MNKQIRLGEMVRKMTKDEERKKGRIRCETDRLECNQRHPQKQLQKAQKQKKQQLQTATSGYTTITTKTTKS